MPVASLPEQPTQASQVHFPAWQQAGMPHLVIGRVQGSAMGNYTVEFQLFNVNTGSQILGLSYNTTLNNLRQVAHQISDEIYKALTGERGVFGTQIVYVVAQKMGKQNQYVLYLADADGANPRTMLRSSEPILSPTWSPDGQRIAYVTYDPILSPKGYRDKQMAVYIQDIRTGKRNRVSIGRGIHGAPAWSPDGTKMALTISQNGNPDVHILNLRTGSLTQLTNDTAVDTEPDWSPDGQSIIFTSDRSGQPQIYRMSTVGSNIQRVTFQGSYNARARFSPDGRKITLLHNGGGGYQIAVMDLDSNRINVLSRTSLDESPSFAPNGSMIIYGTGSSLAAVSIDGRVHQRLSVELGKEVREPAWSPFTE
jgi:TolB protein